MSQVAQYEIVFTYREGLFEQVAARCGSYDEAKKLAAALLKYNRLRPVRAWVRRRVQRFAVRA